jgi:protein-disulfide isomerase-like protein with CxxC motif
VGEIEATLYTDPSCPWAYCASPALGVLRWRYGEQLRLRLVMIGLSEDTKRQSERGYTPARVSAGHTYFRRYGMPFLGEPRPRLTASARACRAVVAARRLAPDREHEVLRALQLAWFNSTLLLDDPADIAIALEAVRGLDVRAVVTAIDDPATLTAYDADRSQARTAAGSPTEFQGKARQTDGPVRYSAPSLVLEAGGRRLEAGGFQPVEAYDVVVANLDPTLSRVPVPEQPLAALQRFPTGLVTQEVAAIMAPNNVAADRAKAERALIELAGEGSVRRVSMGDDALWQLA